MAEKWNRDTDNVSGRSDEELRGVAGETEDEDEFLETADDLDDEEDDEEGGTF
jgi:hypothetical protein